MEKKDKLEKLKNNYEKIRDKYNLPKFEELNDDFEIEKLCEKKTDLLIRNIRRELMEKATNYMRFLEALMNPSNGPMLFMILANQLTEKERLIANNLYKKFGMYFIKSISLDNESNDKEEAEMISRIYKDWTEIKKDFKQVLDVFDTSFEKKKEKKIKDYIC